jgi:hypothetical protein
VKSLTNLSTAKWLLPLSIALFTFISCQKEHQDDLSNEAQNNTVSSTPKAEHESAAVATDWYRLQTRILLERNSALNTTLYWGYMGIGLYEAVRPGIKGAVSFSGKLYKKMPIMPEPENNQGYSWELSANAALASMVRSFFTGLTPANIASIDSLEAAYNEKLRPAEGSTVFDRSQAYGRSIATAMYNWSLTDDLNTSNIGYTLPAPFPGSWQPTPPAFQAIPINPFVKNATPFLVEDLTAISPKFPLAYSETPGSPFYNMVKQVYDVNKALSPEQRAIALFWVDQGNGIGYTPPGHDFLFITQAIEQSHASLATAAEAYAKAGIANREGTIVTFRSKYDNFLVRPVTYIQKVIEPGWLPVFPTPPHPEYPAAHAMVTGTVMQAVERVLGPNITVTDHSYDFRGFEPMKFSSVFNYAEMAGISRNYGGIHYLISINTGLQMAKEIGNRIGDIKLHE